MSDYLDASVLLSTLVGEAAREAVRAYLLTAPPLLVSEFAAAEVASGLSRLVQMRALELEDARSRRADFDLWRAATTEAVDLVAADARLADAYVGASI